MSLPSPRSHLPAVRFAGRQFRGLCLPDVLPPTSGLKWVVTVNADLVVQAFQDTRFARLIDNNHATFDGQVTWWLARWLARPSGIRFEKISGSSLAYQLFEHAARHRQRTFLLGAAPDVNRQALHVVESAYGIEVEGYAPPFAPYPATEDWTRQVLDRIVAFRPEILLVAFGTPKQEFWIEDQREVLAEAGVRLVIGCGGTLDFVAGAIARAPVSVQRMGLEGVYRLLVQPSWFRLRRLARSLLVIPIALWMAAR
jgi:N-acetylglucosaminyldiphosphoundecaprenol N-acetyl-beta-D-mannosaminyltransferase